MNNKLPPQEPMVVLPIPEKRFYIKERTGWFNGNFTHCVQDRDVDRMVCVSSEWCCECVAKCMNIATTPKGQ